jgi:hypothetical protein
LAREKSFTSLFRASLPDYSSAEESALVLFKPHPPDHNIGPDHYSDFIQSNRFSVVLHQEQVLACTTLRASTWWPHGTSKYLRAAWWQNLPGNALAASIRGDQIQSFSILIRSNPVGLNYHQIKSTITIRSNPQLPSDQIHNYHQIKSTITIRSNPVASRKWSKKPHWISILRAQNFA